MNYDQRLNDLMTLLRGRAVDPAAAVETMWGMQDQRRENRMARRQAGSEALSALLGTVSEAATAGTSLDDLIAQQPDPSALAPAAPMLSRLYSPGGYSKTNPMLDPDDEGAISNMVFDMIEHRRSPQAGPNARTDLNTIRQQVVSQIESFTPRADMKHLYPAIDEIISRAYSSAIRTPSSNFYDPPTASTVP